MAVWNCLYMPLSQEVTWVLMGVVFGGVRPGGVEFEWAVGLFLIVLCYISTVFKWWYMQKFTDDHIDTLNITDKTNSKACLTSITWVRYLPLVLYYVHLTNLLSIYIFSYGNYTKILKRKIVIMFILHQSLIYKIYN